MKTATCHPDQPRSSLGLCSRCYMRYHRLRSGAQKTSYLPIPVPEPPQRYERPAVMLPPTPQFESVGPYHLTPREDAAIRAYAANGSIGEGARSLGISDQTMRNHLVKVYEKTGSLTGILGALISLGWLTVPVAESEVRTPLPAPRREVSARHPADAAWARAHEAVSA